MRAIHVLRSLLAAAVLPLASVSAPAAHAALPIQVPCGESALADAINTANAAGGGSLTLAALCTYTLTSAHSSGGAGHPAGLPNITTAISMTGFLTQIARAPGAPAFRIFEVDGPSQVPGANGRLSMTTVTVSGGDAGLGVGGGIANLGGTVTLNSSTVSGSKASYGGGLYTDGSLTLTGSTVTGNTASVAGGGIFTNAGTVTLTGSPVVGNTPTNCGALPPVAPAC
ncbi:hypothetical protein BX264_5651 [Streptomyces sp. 2333.5]|uniref:hypothetical protein n=1 Tax=unclassified Streptomyces TaxID=2593676 RepID=UPI00089D7DFA|nr:MULTISPECIES: hypothetical protein [unclassified Streptomyces]PJJ05196.1 hypothetical protein BX264_5651 [Streptomyces sp. 2333.5]SEE70371.1 hypothetical protein SAMN05428943_5753 [Streptomyces sp. 2314.4]SEE95677.1 hypothetical protein SAMN05428942_5749 [Streptomyces sp. 2112.2]